MNLNTTIFLGRWYAEISISSPEILTGDLGEAERWSLQILKESHNNLWTNTYKVWKKQVYFEYNFLIYSPGFG